ncbi:hypothetical protein JXJ21_19730 [candidate division KSB1 bacterium]|nr:hypothetical protein [candidate division KSB1 bacterium]
MVNILILSWNIFAGIFFQDYDRYGYPPAGDNPDFPDTTGAVGADFYWPEFNPTVVWVAFIIGLLIYLFGYIAGGKLSFGKIILCISVATIIGFFSRSIMNPILGVFINTFGISPQAAFVVTSTLWMIYIVGIGVMLYEMLVVTAEEAHPTD